LDQQVAAQQEQPQATGDDYVAKALQDPRILSAVQEHVAQANQQAHAMGNYYAQAVQANANAATAALISSFSELGGLTAEQVPVAIKTVAQSNPERAQNMVRHIENTRALIAENQRVQAAQAQAYQQAVQQQFQQFQKSSDAAFEEHRVSQGISEEQFGEIQKEALAMLQDYGLSERQIAQAWNTDPNFRSFPAQRMMLDAVRYRMAQRGAHNKLVKDAPQVQRPGSPLSRGTDEEYSTRELNQRIDRTSGRQQLLAAAELVAQRRARNGR
jgi:hypothetical protein